MRIVSLVPSATETLFYLGLGDHVKAVTRYCRLPAEVKEKQKVGGTKDPDLKRIIELRPDVVIVDCDENRREDADALRAAGLELFVTFPKSIEDAVQMLNQMGARFNAKEAASRIIDEIIQRKTELRDLPVFKTLVLIWQDPYMTVSEETYVHSVCKDFGFLAAGETPAVQRYPKISDEEISEHNPEVVLFPTDPFPFRTRNVAQFKERFPHIKASRNDDLFIVDGTYLTWHGYATLRALREFPSFLREKGIWRN